MLDLLKLETIWESYLTSYGTVAPYVVLGWWVVFTALMIVATIGRKVGLRRRYVKALDLLFTIAASKLNEEDVVEDNNNDEFENNVVIDPEAPRAPLSSSTPGQFSLEEPMPYLAAGMRAIVQDCIGKSFSPEELKTWNMLSRTKRMRHRRLSPSMTLLWVVGCIIRYFFLMPMRVVVLCMSLSTMCILTSLVGLLPSGKWKKKINAYVVCWCFDFVAGSLSVVARFNNKENRPQYGIAVANHTSPIDSMVLATDQCYDMVGQKAKGLLGAFMNALSKSSSHIWFERKNAKDRSAVSKLLQEHADDHSLPPILLFPEGTCVNNTAVLQFKKGAFEIDSVIYPIAIRFDPRYGDAFWWQDTFLEYVFSMMTSWAIVADIWYLPPMRKGPNESAVAFSERVKALIAHRGGFVNMTWDGF
ncbi:unnamed protein product, partial [Meganyctiphanes norvegica]